MIKKVMTGLLCCALTFCISGCGSHSDNTSSNARHIDGLLKQGELTVVVDDTTAPNVYRDENNNLVGFEVDCGNAIGEYLGLKVNWVSNAWENLITTVQAGKADAVINAVYITPEREEVVQFCDPYYRMEEVIVLREGDTSITSPEDLIGKTVGVQPASKDLDDIEALGVTDIKEYSKIPDGFLDLTNERIDAFVTEHPHALLYAEDGGYEVLMDCPVGSSNTGIVTNKATPEVTAAINEAIAALKKDGTFKDISIKWFGSDVIVYDEVE